MFTVTPPVSACVYLTFVIWCIHFQPLFNQMHFFQKRPASHCVGHNRSDSSCLMLRKSMSISLPFMLSQPLHLPVSLLPLSLCLPSSLSSWRYSPLPGLSSSRQSLLLLLHLHHPPSLLPTAALCQPCCPGAAFTSSSHPVPSPSSHTLLPFSAFLGFFFFFCPKNPIILHLCL